MSIIDFNHSYVTHRLVYSNIVLLGHVKAVRLTGGQKGSVFDLPFVAVSSKRFSQRGSVKEVQTLSFCSGKP